MKTVFSPYRTARTESGAALLIVLSLLALAGALLLCNSNALHGLKRELLLLEEKQQKRFAPEASARPPNSAPVRTAPAR